MGSQFFPQLDAIGQVLLRCTIINYALLLLWFVIMMNKHEWIFRMSTGANFRISREQFDSYNFIGIILYKCVIVLFFLVPYIAIRLVVG